VPISFIHQATATTSWRILSLLRLGDRRIRFVKQALQMTESAFSHALRKLEESGMVETRKVGREKVSRLTHKGRIVFSSLQALCFTMGSNDGTVVEDDTALLRVLREAPQSLPPRGVLKRKPLAE
jgi:DNA-binding transcriptional ArsR family regulator